MIKIFAMAACMTLPTVVMATGMDFVSDPKLCGLDEMQRFEQGTSFDGQSFVEIEYHCELQSPIDMPSWTEFQTQIRAGYCEEPGLLTPLVFVIRSSDYEPGIIYVYKEETYDPETYHLCR